jgi:hypothetical protein
MAIEISTEAQAELSKMLSTVAWIGDTFGYDSARYVEAAETLMVAYHKILTLGGNVYRDSDLGLICHNEHITYGICFHMNDDNSGFWSVNS